MKTHTREELVGLLKAVMTIQKENNKYLRKIVTGLKTLEKIEING